MVAGVMRRASILTGARWSKESVELSHALMAAEELGQLQLNWRVGARLLELRRGRCLC